MSGLFEGPSLSLGAESYKDHVARLGPLPHSGSKVMETLDESGLRGRGGAGFPVGAKWRTVADRSKGRAAVLANGAEGEPLSSKDRVLMETRPHLVIDGSLLAARATEANKLVLYIGSEYERAHKSMRTALSERNLPDNISVSMVRPPAKYVAGEESAAVNCVNDRLALPQTKPPRPFERGVGGSPTLVNNVESLAYAAMIARRGSEWFRGLGRSESSGTILVTISGDVERPGVLEVPHGSSLRAAIEGAGGSSRRVSAVLLGGYFGTWVNGDEVDQLTLDSTRLRAAGRSLGCGVIHVLPRAACGVAETAAIVEYLASESARQCGPCHFGLEAIAGALTRLATNVAEPGDLMRLLKWSREIRGRGACGHPDGAAMVLESALSTFANEFILHQEHRLCGVAT